MPLTLMPSHGSPGPSQKFQIARRMRLLTYFGSKKGAEINLIRGAPFPEPFSSVSQTSRQRTPFRFPNGTPFGESYPFPVPFFYMSLEFLDKSSIKNKFHPSLEDPRKGSSPMVPKTGTPWKQTPISRALLGISFWVPNKGALPPGSPHRAPKERYSPFLEASIHLSKSPVYEPASRFPSRAPMKIDARLQSLPLHILRGP